jgi:hypothetical protein
MHAQTVVVHELAKAPPAGPSTHSFQQGHWCFFSLSQKRGPGHGTWLHNKTHTQPGRFSATIDKWCTAHIEPCTADATNFLISCGGMYQVQTIIQLLLFFLINLSTEIGSEDQNGVHAVSSSFWKTILEWFMKFAL